MTPHTPSASAEPVFARWRKPFGRLAAVIYLAALLFTASPPSIWTGLLVESIGSMLVITATLGRIWCALYIAGRKNEELCQEGPYSLSRNPLYCFSFLGVVGIALAMRLLPVALLIGGIFWMYHIPVIRAEEERLQLLFGEQYTQYRARVPRLWPNLSGYSSHLTTPVDRHRIERALSEVVWFLAALVIVDLVEHLRTDVGLPALISWRY